MENSPEAVTASRAISRLVGQDRTSDESEVGGKPRMENWSIRPVAMLVAGTLFMEILDGTIIATAAPSMARSFHVASPQVGVCITAYLVTVATLIPISGWLAERWGARRIYLISIATFVLASVLCAASTSLTEITVMRVLQGIGGAMMVPVGRLVVLSSTSKQNVIRAVAYLTWPALLAPVLAPAVGGLLTTYATWPWIFLINVPLGVVAALFAIRIMPRVVADLPGALDWRGFTTSATSLACLVTGAALLGQSRVPWIPTLILIAVGILVGAFSVRHMLRFDHPLVGLDVLRIQTFRASQAGGSLFRLGINTAPFVLPLLFQDRFGWSPARAGGMVLVLFVGNLAIKPLTTPLLRAVRFRTLLLVAIAAASLCVAGCALLSSTTPTIVIALLLGAGGVFRSIGHTCYNTIAFADIEQPMMSQANTFLNTTQQLTTALGVAAAVVSLKLGAELFGTGAMYSFTFLVLAFIVLLSVVDAVKLPRTAGDGIRLAASISD